MKVNISCKGFTANNKQIELIEKKFDKLSKYFDDDVVANVTMGFRKSRQTMEAMISVKGMLFRAEYTDMDMNVCLDKVVERLSTQITKYKKKIQKSHRHVKGINFEEVPESDLEEEEFSTIRVKKFEISPMDTQEAILQMELLEHNFFVFMNSEIDSISVVYKRKDGTYGILEPIYA